MRAADATASPTVTPTISPTVTPQVSFAGDMPVTPTPSSSASPTPTVKPVNPKWNGDVATWDCVYFGYYWQDDTNGDRKGDRNDWKKSIKWRVLSVSGNDAFLLADKSLDCRPYHEKTTNVTWERSTLRSWLNGYDGYNNDTGTNFTDDNFINNAFSSDEQAALLETKVANEKENLKDYPSGGNDTMDKVYIPSVLEMSNSSYGFPKDYAQESSHRKTDATAYAIGQGPWMVSYLDVNMENRWWLRSPGLNSIFSFSVNSTGSCVSDGGGYVGNLFITVRPVIHISLTSTLWSYAGTVSSDGTSDEKPATIVIPVHTATPTPTPSPTATPAPTAAPGGTAAPTAQPGITPAPVVTPTPSYIAPTAAPADVWQGKIFEKASGFSYTVTNLSGKTVSIHQFKNKEATEIAVPNAVEYKGEIYQVTAIEKAVFKGMSKLKSVTVGSNVKKIGASAFNGCSSLKLAVLPENVTTIGANAFRNCKKLRYLIVNTSKLKNVGERAFKGTANAITVKTARQKRTKYKKLFRNYGNISKKAKYISEPTKVQYNGQEY